MALLGSELWSLERLFFLSEMLARVRNMEADATDDAWLTGKPKETKIYFYGTVYLFLRIQISVTFKAHSAWRNTLVETFFLSAFRPLNSSIFGVL